MRTAIRKKQKSCACGCGNKIINIKSKYLRGHNGRGIPRTQEEKDNLSKKLKEYLAKPEAIEQRRLSATGRKHNDDSKIKMSKAATKREQNKKNDGYKAS